MFVTIPFPMARVLLIMGGIMTSYVLSRWNGRPETPLLLRMIEEPQKR